MKRQGDDDLRTSDYKEFLSLRRQVVSNLPPASEKKEDTPPRWRRNFTRKAVDVPTFELDGTLSSKNRNEFVSQFSTAHKGAHYFDYDWEESPKGRFESTSKSQTNIPYKLYRKKALQEHPEIVSKTRKFDETDFQKELVQFVSQKLLKSPETEFYEENKDKVKGNLPNVGIHKSIYISSSVEK